MAKIKEFIYISRKRYHTPEYLYRIALENRNKELVICHQAIIGDEWKTTHSIGIKRADLTRMLKASKK